MRASLSPGALRTVGREGPGRRARFGWLVATLIVAASATGCAGSSGGSPANVPGPEPLATASVVAPPDAPPGDPFEIVGTLAEEPLPDAVPSLPVAKLPLPAVMAGVPPRPAHCEPFVRRAPAKLLVCGERAGDLESLAKALDEQDAARRDGMLRDLEPCGALPAGLVTGLRAELAPTECADGLVDAIVARPPESIDPLLFDALCGYALAARLARTVSQPPTLEPPFDRKRVEQFHAGPIAQWGRTSAGAVQQLAQRAASLGFYGKAVAAVEAGMADMRFVEAVRGVPLPEEFAKDRELADAFYQSLDGALGPRKDRGRDAALAGLRGFALVGIVAHPRVAQARTLLSKMYGGRPIDALDPLRLPPRVAAAPASVPERLAARLPTFYAGLLLDAEQALEPAVLGQLTLRGIPLVHRIALRKAALSPEQRLLLARARLDMGRTYWRASDVDEATGLLTAAPALAGDAPRLLLGVALGLRGGPADAATMIRRAPLDSLGIGKVAALDAIAAGQGGVEAEELRAFAEFDAAVLRQLAASPEADAAYWQGIAARFERARARLSDRPTQAAAAERAKEALDIARVIGGAAMP